MTAAAPPGEQQGAASGKPATIILSDLTIAPGPAAPVVLAGVSLAVAPGQCVALVGPSGSGKTTLLRTIAGMIPPRDGRIAFEGQDLSAVGAEQFRRLRHRIAIVAQKHDLVEALRVDKNVMAGALGRWSNWRALRFLAWATADELAEAEAALASVGLPGMARRPTAQLSGGEQQRVAIARALVQAPSLLLADEPVASLDPVNAGEILALLTGLARSRGMALICSLHQPALAARLCDRVLELSGGRLVERS